MPSPALDSTDLAILARLQRDGRIANVDLAEEVSLSPSSCLRRTKALEAQGVIAGYRAELSREQLGLGLTVFMELTVDRHSRRSSREIEEGLAAIPAVVAAHLVSGDADYFVEAVVPSLAAYEEVLLDRILAIGPVTAARSIFALRTALSRGPLPLDHLR
ncbi:Lrp/AsnC family transcriptional regulator [Actinocrinis sp.]|uniref:Lrp/AsnC family transcriptional regulator n=1 Tax=Actinocrinis sp. TaxID=1920516 RepID=UPI002BB7BD10|nr:Lrp/AsnC family transcriptional regulator [Actinocrinis sp.]HXR71126.1 Lrp/AsnC family transcriptional regulator [Actinocrinis sp.]